MGWSKATVVAVAKRTGYPVVEAWSSKNMGTMGTVYGPMLHHTATPASAPGDYPSLRVVRDGRPGVENSLSMYGLGRSGTIYCINEKVSWHSGAGSWLGIRDGNGYFAGIEAESSGYGDWTPAQLDSYKKLVASILLETGRSTQYAPAHREWAPTRKIDPGGIDLAAFRADVNRILANPALLNVKGGEEELSVNTVIEFTNPDTGKITKFTVAQYLAWTNYYVSKLYTLFSGGPEDISNKVWTTTVSRKVGDEIKNVSALQELADVKSMLLNGAGDSREVKAAVTEAVTSAMSNREQASAEEVAQEVLNQLSTLLGQKQNPVV